MTTRVHLVDYDAGNLRSMTNALRAVGAEVILADRGEALAEATRVVLPGVGAFGAAMERLRARGLDVALRRHIDAGGAMLGVCLGFQVLFERGEEQGDHAGLGVVPGVVRRFPEGLIVPHMGWNEVAWSSEHGLVRDLPSPSHMYFVHSYRPEGVPSGWVAGWTPYGAPFPAAIARGGLLAVQFHPERSGPAGLHLLSRWVHGAT